MTEIGDRQGQTDTQTLNNERQNKRMINKVNLLTIAAADCQAPPPPSPQPQ